MLYRVLVTRLSIWRAISCYNWMSYFSDDAVTKLFLQKWSTAKFHRAVERMTISIPTAKTNLVWKPRGESFRNKVFWKWFFKSEEDKKLWLVLWYLCDYNRRILFPNANVKHSFLQLKSDPSAKIVYSSTCQRFPFEYLAYSSWFLSVQWDFHFLSIKTEKPN